MYVDEGRKLGSLREDGAVQRLFSCDASPDQIRRKKKIFLPLKKEQEKEKNIEFNSLGL